MKSDDLLINKAYSSNPDNAKRKSRQKPRFNHNVRQCTRCLHLKENNWEKFGYQKYTTPKGETLYRTVPICRDCKALESKLIWRERKFKGIRNVSEKESLEQSVWQFATKHNCSTKVATHHVMMGCEMCGTKRLLSLVRIPGTKPARLCEDCIQLANNIVTRLGENTPKLINILTRDKGVTNAT